MREEKNRARGRTPFNLSEKSAPCPPQCGLALVESAGLSEQTPQSVESENAMAERRDSLRSSGQPGVGHSNPGHKDAGAMVRRGFGFVESGSGAGE